MDLMLDLAVVGLASIVSVSLGLLAWALGVTAVGGVRRTLRDMDARQLRLAAAERRLRDTAAGADRILARLASRTRQRQGDG